MKKLLFAIPVLVTVLLLASFVLLFLQPQIGSFLGMFSAASSAIFLALARS